MGTQILSVRTSPIVGARVVTQVAVLIHELATNGAQCGILSEHGGQLTIEVVLANGEVDLRWADHCRKALTPPSRHGFRTRLETTVKRSLEATIQREWLASGLIANVKIPAEQNMR
jgi:two-component sensor histidine kinase